MHEQEAPWYMCYELLSHFACIVTDNTDAVELQGLDQRFLLYIRPMFLIGLLSTKFHLSNAHGVDGRAIQRIRYSFTFVLPASFISSISPNIKPST
jgi:hypothetical protein